MDAERHEIICFPTVLDQVRGNLTYIEFPYAVGFDVKRVFYVFGNQAGVVRGRHAHKTCQQVLIALRGLITVKVAEGEYTLSDPGVGLFIGTGVYTEIVFNEEDSILLVLASEHYDPKDYINDYQVS